jgi:hypothetical protein
VPATPRPIAAALLALVLIAHATLAVRTFPSLAAIADDRPVVMVDHALHLYHGALGARFLREHGTTWGYDPHFMAGYPETPVWDSSSNLSILFQSLAGGRYSPAAYKVGLLACGLLLLPLIALAARAVGLAPGATLAAALLAFVYLWTGFPRSLWLSGLFSFITASCAVVYLLGMVVHLPGSPRPRHWAALWLVATLALWAHVTTPIMALGGLVGYLLTGFRRRPTRGRLALVGAAALAVLPNLVWLAPQWRFRRLRTGTGFFMTTDSPLWLPEYLLLQPGDGQWSGLVVALGLVGLVAWWRSGRRVAAATLGGSAVALLLLTALGSLWGPTRMLEPLRFRVPAVLLLSVPAGSAVASGLAAIRRRAGGRGRGAIAAGTAGALAVTLLVLALPTTAKVVLYGLTARSPLVVGLRPEMTALVQRLRRDTDPTARILFEDQLRLLESTDAESTHWTPLLPELLRPEARGFLGGLYAGAFIAHHQGTSFADYQLAGRPLDAWSARDLDAFFARYNVGWAVAWSPLSRWRLDRQPGVVKLGEVARWSTPGRRISEVAYQYQGTTIARASGLDAAQGYLDRPEGRYALYRVDRPRSYFLRGTGRVESATANRVVLRDVTPDAGAAILSLHWLDTWRSDPPVRLSRSPVAGDPVGFVRIEAGRPLPRLVLDNGYGRR